MLTQLPCVVHHRLQCGDGHVEELPEDLRVFLACALGQSLSVNPSLSPFSAPRFLLFLLVFIIVSVTISLYVSPKAPVTVLCTEWVIRF